MNKERVCKNANAIMDRLTYANSSINIFCSVIKVYNSQESDVLLPDINFWKVVLDNCIFRALVELAKTYEEGTSSVGLKKLINQVEQISENNTTKQLVIETREKYSATEGLCKKLRTLRDKGLVHADKGYVLDLKTLTKEYGLSIEEIQLLINNAAEICNDILVEFTGTGRSLALLLNDDASWILDDLRFARTERKIHRQKK